MQMLIQLMTLSLLILLSKKKKLNSRIGVAVIDTANNVTVSYRGNERFPLNSTFKALLCGMLLNQNEAIAHIGKAIFSATDKKNQ